MNKVNNSSLNIAFEQMLNENSNLKEMEVARFLPVIGFILELIIEIAGVFIVYYMMKFLAPFIVGESVNNNYLYSMLLIPIIYSLKKFPDVFKSLFVRVAISEEFVVCKRGFFRKFIDKLYVSCIDNVEIRTTIWGEWLNYGVIDLYSFGGKIRLPFVKNPCVVYFELKDKMEKCKKNSFVNKEY